MFLAGKVPYWMKTVFVKVVSLFCRCSELKVSPRHRRTTATHLERNMQQLLTTSHGSASRFSFCSNRGTSKIYKNCLDVSFLCSTLFDCDLQNIRQFSFSSSPLIVNTMEWRSTHRSVSELDLFDNFTLFLFFLRHFETVSISWTTFLLLWGTWCKYAALPPISCVHYGFRTGKEQQIF